jgi:hypothetical protein
MLVYVTNLGGWGGGKLSFQCLRPSASLRAAGKNKIVGAQTRNKCSLGNVRT